MSKVTLLEPGQVPEQVLDIAPEELLLKSMLIDGAGQMGVFLENALHQGTKVELIGDYHSVIMPGWKESQGFFRAHPEIDVDLINPFQFWQIGPLIRWHRDHRKIGIAQNGNATPTLFLGGANWVGDMFGSMDVCAMVQDAPDLAEVIRKSHFDNYEEDLEIGGLDRDTFRVIADSGRFGKSLILDRALETLYGAKSGEDVTVMTQFSPDGLMLKALGQAASRGVKVNLITNNPKSAPLIAWATAKAVMIENWTRGITNNLIKSGVNIIYPGRFVHGKALVTQTEALWGSHNFTQFTLYLGGMREACIASMDPEIVGLFNGFFSDLIKRETNLLQP